MRPRANHLREHIAREAARIMVVSGSRDFQAAKRKAAELVGATGRAPLPGNAEIERAIHAYQRLFRAHSQPQRLRYLRRVALDAIRFLGRFEPCLVGPVLSGTADQHSDIDLHLFAEPSEEVGSFLQEHGIQHKLGERRYRFPPDETRSFPAYRYLVRDEVPLELVVFPHRGRRQPPLSPVDGRPMRRAGALQVERLTAEASRPSSPP